MGRRRHLPGAEGGIQRWLRVSLIVLMAGLAAAAACIAVLTIRQQNLFEALTRYNSMFETTLGAVEFMRLQTDVAAYALPNMPVERADVQLRLDVLRNRLSVLREGEVRMLIRRNPENAGLLDRLEETIGRVQALLDQPASDENSREMLLLLGELNVPMVRLAASTHMEGSNLVGEDQGELRGLYVAFIAVLLAMIAAGAGLSLLLVQQNRQIRRIALEDPLTGLPNRRALLDRLAELLAAPARRGSGRGARRRVPMLLLDLDCFKDVNDTLGHVAGDGMLREIARRLRGSVPKGGPGKDPGEYMVARLGGDEFAVLPPPGLKREALSDLAMRLGRVVNRPLEMEGRLIMPGVSIGIADLAPGQGDAVTLMRHADLALYEAKGEGRNTCRFFEERLLEAAEERQRLQSDLAVALREGQFEVHYQPQVHLVDGRITGLEALLRWRHPRLGLIGPQSFIPVAEQSGLIVPIGDWVLRQACTDAARWPEEIRLAVNLSPRQFADGGLLIAVARALAASGLPARRLELEITESLLLQDDAGVLAALAELRELGIGIALDDFGIAYSSFDYLRRFRFEKIKIDRSFVHAMATRPDCLAIVRTMADLARRLGMATTVEGLESEELVRLALQAGYTEGQGYYFDGPLTAARVLERLERAPQYG
ncbi:bifunctional diguanylate cyclase/phosphodiesterase [Roseomonas gilardii subsp. gilardii]|uniref:putative bifunctional diguanylate cyclase/phosphodiesterase n=1 Tax=Roseomonas gilardii TaxID=257708 RepID=UPI001FFC024B|nr:bifunctional diguanylate cyclase/phosphodiesterase [Roseomonas gilardii]UPG72263.1 bifunctional diguanylate cyclase/phosphodiesterase [Roseomonas gilardii subsp. gilardii]